MNYYKITGIPKNKYITGYEKKNNIIIIKLANTEKYVVKNTIDNENKILEKMNKQASLIVNNKKSKKIGDYIFIYGSGFVSICIFCYHTIFNVANLVNGIISLNNVLFAMFSIISIIYIFVILRCFNKEDNNLKKIILFCETKELLNNNIKKSGKNKMSLKVTRQISDNYIDEELLTINSINKISLEDLQILKDNIEREKEFDLGEEPIAYKTKTKRKN